MCEQAAAAGSTPQANRLQQVLAPPAELRPPLPCAPRSCAAPVADAGGACERVRAQRHHEAGAGAHVEREAAAQAVRGVQVQLLARKAQVGGARQQACQLRGAAQQVAGGGQRRVVPGVAPEGIPVPRGECGGGGVARGRRWGLRLGARPRGWPRAGAGAGAGSAAVGVPSAAGRWAAPMPVQEARDRAAVGPPSSASASQPTARAPRGLGSRRPPAPPEAGLEEVASLRQHGPRRGGGGVAHVPPAQLVLQRVRAVRAACARKCGEVWMLVGSAPGLLH
jgi:hypothetical protein